MRPQLAYFRANELVNPDDDPTDLTTTVAASMGINAALAIYPNPAHERAQVVLPDASPGQLELLDVSGRSVRMWRTNGVNATLDLNTVRKGTYLLWWCCSDGRIGTIRLVRD